jgi:hypothetical protein
MRRVSHMWHTWHMCHTVTQCDTIAQKKDKFKKMHKVWQLRNWIDYAMWHCDTFVTPNVFQSIRQSNYSRRHGRGTYLLFFETPFLHEKTVKKRRKKWKSWKKVKKYIFSLFFSFLIVFKNSEKKYLFSLFFRPIRSHVAFSRQIFKSMGANWAWDQFNCSARDTNLGKQI